MPVTTAVPSASPLLPLPRGRPPPTDPLAPPHLSGACCPGYLCSHSVAGPSSLWGVNHSLVPGALLLGALRRYMWRGLPVLWTPNRPVGHLCPRGWPCLTFRVPGHIVSGWHSRSGGEDWVSMPWGRRSSFSRLWITLPAPFLGRVREEMSWRVGAAQFSSLLLSPCNSCPRLPSSAEGQKGPVTDPGSHSHCLPAQLP